MRTIDILTSQNVTITYQLAGLQERIFAFVIDIIILGTSYLIIATIMSQVIGITSETVFGAVLFIYMSFYTLVSEILLDGQSLGKKALGIKVVKLEGIEPSLNDYLVRWAFRPIDIWFTIGTVGCMMISSSTKGQRLGDVIANTTVVKTAPDQKIFLNDIMHIKSLENYQPVYPQVREFQEEDMLLIKEVMDRYNRHRNNAHEEVLNETLEIVKAKLNLDVIPKDRIAFIRTLIKDYVAMSR